MRTSMKFFVFLCALAAAAADTNETFHKLTGGVYLTPAVIMLGHDNGTLVRCLQDDPKNCEVFHEASSKISDLVINGEYIYVARQLNNVLRCHLYTKHCEDFSSWGTWLDALTIGRGRLFVGHDNGAISVCELNHPRSCKPLNFVNNAVRSLIQIDNYIYAGTINGQLMRCSLQPLDNSCVEIYNMNDTITGLASMGSRIYAVTYQAHFAYCLRTITNCEKLTLLWSRPVDLAAYNGLLYLQEYGITNVCQTVNDHALVSYTMYAFRRRAINIAMAYGTYHMQRRYKNEHTTCTLQNSKCPLVIYYNEQQRAALEVYVKDGRLFNSNDSLVDTRDADQGYAIFAMGPDGRILLSNLHPRGLIHTSSLFAGNPVAGAGEMIVENGVIKKIRACSEHYKPDLELNKQVIQSLLTQGYTDPIEAEACCEAE